MRARGRSARETQLLPQGFFDRLELAAQLLAILAHSAEEGVSTSGMFSSGGLEEGKWRDGIDLLVHFQTQVPAQIVNVAFKTVDDNGDGADVGNQVVNMPLIEGAGNFRKRCGTNGDERPHPSGANLLVMLSSTSDSTSLNSFASAGLGSLRSALLYGFIKLCLTWINANKYFSILVLLRSLASMVVVSLLDTKRLVVCTSTLPRTASSQCCIFTCLRVLSPMRVSMVYTSAGVLASRLGLGTGLAASVAACSSAEVGIATWPIEANTAAAAASMMGFPLASLFFPSGEVIAFFWRA